MCQMPFSKLTIDIFSANLKSKLIGSLSSLRASTCRVSRAGINIAYRS